MAYQLQDFSPPPLPPDLVNAHTFQQLRESVKNYLSLQTKFQADFFKQVVQNANRNFQGAGPQIVAARTITITQSIHTVIGQSVIDTIRAPQGFQGGLVLASRDGFTIENTGNIRLFQSPNYLDPGAYVHLTYHPLEGQWYMDTCRLQNRPGGGGTLLTPGLVGQVQTGTGIGSVPGWIGPLTDGQVLIGVTGGQPAAAAITGTLLQILVTLGAGSIGLKLDGPHDFTSQTDHALVLGRATGALASMPSLGLATEVLTSQGPGFDPIWAPAAGGGATQYTPRVEAIGSSPFTVAFGDFLAASASAGADFIANLPAATGTGKLVVIKKMDANAHNIAITPNAAETIDGAAGATNIATQYASVTLIDYALGAWAVI